MTAHDAHEVMQEIDECDLLSMCNTQIFSTSCKRETFFVKNFNFVPPRQIFLGIDKHGVKRFCQYIPILHTLRNFVSKYCHLFENMHNTNTGDILCDVHDGSLCKNNLLFASNPNSLKILLYQDRAGA
jgi:hypothetical protein